MIQMEIGFNILYLLSIYLIVGLMFHRYRNENYANQPGSVPLLWAFFLLALGDTGHVGFRLLAFARGGLEQNEVLVGLGALATAVTITIFYMLMLEIWRRQNNKPKTWIFWLVMLLGVLRLVIMTFPENHWGQVVPPYRYSLIRNAFLTAMGIVVVAVCLRDGKKKKNRYLVNSAIAIICSFAFYIPVFLYVQKVPMIGMLMIPKTIAYVVMATIGLRHLFLRR